MEKHQQGQKPKVQHIGPSFHPLAPRIQTEAGNIMSLSYEVKQKPVDFHEWMDVCVCVHVCIVNISKTVLVFPQRGTRLSGSAEPGFTRSRQRPVGVRKGGLRNNMQAIIYYKGQRCQITTTDVAIQ